MGDTTASRQGPRAYQYLPLDEGLGEIRLLHLLPGAFSSPIRVILESTPFSPEATPQFEALSYTWGSADNPVDIFIGSSGYYTLAVTRNLAEALPYFRLKDRLRTLWIDAICVNQSDLAERTSQVKRMADIYSKATRVVVWLGPALEDSSMAIDVFNTICSRVTIDWQTYLFRSASADTGWADRNTSVSLDQAQSNSILSLLSRPWFQRLWIWQEVRLPPGDIIVMCGHKTIPWNSVCLSVIYLLRMDVSDLLKRRADLLFPLCSRRSSGYVPLGSLLDRTKYCECSDPRDRIFALLSLLDPSERVIGIEADYSKTVSEVYINAALCIIKFSQRIDIMAMAGYEESTLGIPSWVPKWPCRAINQPIRHSQLASGETLADIGDEDCDGILRLIGVSVTTIDRAQGFKLPGYTFAATTDIGHEMRRIASWISIRRPFDEDSEDLLAFCRTVCSDHFAERYHPQRAALPSLKECLQALCLLLGVESNVDNWNRRFLAHAGRYICGRSFFVTKDGRLGLGPQASKPGDIVTVLLGGPTAFILRPVESGHYQLIGEAYCHGLMDAEALLGSLPGRFRLISKREERTKYAWKGHVDCETESFYCEDPRLGKLPMGWERRGHPSDKYWNWFVNEETGQEMKDRGDPRLTPEALKQRGVDLKVFKLV